LSSSTSYLITSYYDAAALATSINNASPTAVNFNGYLFINPGASICPGVYTGAYLIKLAPPTGGGGTVFVDADVTYVLNRATEWYDAYGTVGSYKNRMYVSIGLSLITGGYYQ